MPHGLWELERAGSSPARCVTVSPFCLCLVSSAIIPVLRKALWRQLQTRLLSVDGPPASGPHHEVLAQLVPFARAKDLGVLMDRLPSLLQTPGRHER